MQVVILNFSRTKNSTLAFLFIPWFVFVYIRIRHYISFAYFSQMTLIIHATSQTRLHLETLHETLRDIGRETGSTKKEMTKRRKREW